MRTKSDQREVQRRQNAERERRMIQRALANEPSTSEVRELRDPAYERWMVERAERKA